MTALLSRFPEPKDLGLIPVGANGTVDLDGHAIPLSFNGVPLGETFFENPNAEVRFDGDGWELKALYLKGADITDEPVMAWIVQSVERYINAHSEMVDHDYV